MQKSTLGIICTRDLANPYHRFTDVGAYTIHFTLGEFLNVLNIDVRETIGAQGNCVTFFLYT